MWATYEYRGVGRVVSALPAGEHPDRRTSNPTVGVECRLDACEGSTADAFIASRFNPDKTRDGPVER